ncbi:RNA-binding S4 domain-containing protein [Candidatus Colwellia aromaticivorans]|uniref:RNA-binding S4 domain-containing protein n=1 Tax=Candidatus Colwellia aromaticivorans TaxID=2267621 RepID=UPI000DF2FAD6|nr:RNA-binding S4 domain-containing protein [Candidatus Colwellia aromaticivorans]
MSESYLEIELDQQPIELCKLLKIANLVAGGGEAKVVISEGYVLLNGEVEYQKRKKVYHNDIVEFNGEMLQIIVNENLEDELSEEKIEQTTQTRSTASFVDKQKKIAKSEKKSAAISKDEHAAKKSKRKPISF